jgi:hypothetical protein
MTALYLKKFLLNHYIEEYEIQFICLRIPIKWTNIVYYIKCASVERFIPHEVKPSKYNHKSRT